ncbi:MAG: hypothetical protein ACO2OZ_01130, partial [Acidilobaceae archaeon]
MTVLNVFEADTESIQRELSNPMEPKVRVYNVKPLEPSIPEACIAILKNSGYYDIREGRLYTTRKLKLRHGTCANVLSLEETVITTIDKIPEGAVVDVMRIYVLDKVKRDLGEALRSAEVLGILASIENKLNENVK